MAELTFEKVGDKYVAEFDATNIFNLHVEKPAGAILSVFQNTGEGTGYAKVEDFQPGYTDVVDCTFIDEIFPKKIRVMCDAAPTYACVTIKE